MPDVTRDINRLYASDSAFAEAVSKANQTRAALQHGGARLDAIKRKLQDLSKKIEDLSVKEFLNEADPEEANLLRDEQEDLCREAEALSREQESRRKALTVLEERQEAARQAARQRFEQELASEYREQVEAFLEALSSLKHANEKLRETERRAEYYALTLRHPKLAWDLSRLEPAKGVSVKVWRRKLREAGYELDWND